MKKPRLTAPVMRGLVLIASSSIVVDYLNGCAERAECSHLTGAELRDAAHAHTWIFAMHRWRNFHAEKRG